MGVERLVLDHAQDGEVVGQAAGRGDDLDEFGLEGGDALGGLVEAVGAAGAGEVVGADQKGGSGGAEGGAELGQLRAGGLLGRFDLEIDDVGAGFGGFEEDFELGVQGPGEVAAKGLAAASGDGRDLAVAGEEGLEVGQGGGGLGQEIEAELNENRVFNGGFGRGKELGGVAPWTAMHSLPTRRRGTAEACAGSESSVLETARGISFN